MGYRIGQADGLHVVYETGDPDKWLATFKELEHAEGFKAWRESLQPQPTGPTVRCRIAVGVSADGWWGTFGSSDESTDRRKVNGLHDCYGDEIDAHHFIEADVPLPQRVEPVVIQGTVVQ